MFKKILSFLTVSAGLEMFLVTKSGVTVYLYLDRTIIIKILQ